MMYFPRLDRDTQWRFVCLLALLVVVANIQNRINSPLTSQLFDCCSQHFLHLWEMLDSMDLLPYQAVGVSLSRNCVRFRNMHAHQ